MTTTTRTRPKPSVVGLLLAVVGTAISLAVASPAMASSGSPIGELDGAGAYAAGTVYGWAADPETPYSAIRVRLDLYRYSLVCPGWGACFPRHVLAETRTQTADYWSYAAGVELEPYGARWNPYHGFQFVLSYPEYSDGDRACVTAINVREGSDSSLGCVTLVKLT